jgi:hypothetical protein
MVLWTGSLFCYANEPSPNGQLVHQYVFTLYAWIPMFVHEVSSTAKWTFWASTAVYFALYFMHISLCFSIAKILVWIWERLASRRPT